MTRTRITKLDMESPSEAEGEAFVTDGAGNVVISGIPAEGHTHLEIEITDIEHDAVKIRGRDVGTDAPTDGEVYKWDSTASEWIPSGVVTVDEKVGDVQEEGISKATAVSILNFKGTAVNQVTDEGGGKVDIDLTASGSGATNFLGLTDTPANYTGDSGKVVIVKGTEDGLEFGVAAGGGADLTVRDEGTLLTASGNSLDFTGTAVTATVSGTAVTVDVPGLIVSIPEFVGARYVMTNEIATNNSDFWSDWDIENDATAIYEVPVTFIDFDRTLNVPEVGYYNVAYTITISGTALPAAGNLNVGAHIFFDGQVVGVNNQIRASGDMSLHLSTTIFIDNTAKDLYVTLFNEGHNNSVYPNILSGYKTTLTVHKVQGSILGIHGVRTVQVHSGSITITTGTDTDVDFNAEIYDLDNFWSTTNREEFTIPSSGYYRVQGLMTWDRFGGGTDRRFWIEKNGTTILAEVIQKHPGPSTTEELTQTVSTDDFFDVGDVIRFRVWHNRGENLNIVPGNAFGDRTNATISKIGRPS